MEWVVSAISDNIITKLLLDLTLDVIVGWAVIAKNDLYNFYKLSPGN